jgi:hypothetical protein
MRTETREALKLVVEKARRLYNGHYLQQVNEKGGTNLSYSYTRQSDGPGGAVTIDYMHPDDDATDALALTFRFFIMASEMASFRWLANNALNDPGLSVDWKRGFTQARDDFNAFLDSLSHIRERLVGPVPGGSPGEVQVVSESQLTNREIMDTFFYGGLAHAEPKKRQTLERWKAMPLFFPMMQAQFDHIVMMGLHVIIYVGSISDLELARQDTP